MNSLAKKIPALAWLTLGLATTAAAHDAESPNIVYILADDLGYGDLGGNGQKRFSTPHLDRLAKQGLVFTQHYSGATVCAPSRSALMTGQHTGHTPIRGNLEWAEEGQHPLPDDIATLPRLLKQAGYVTGAFGKWGLGYPGSVADPMEHFDRFFGYNCQRLSHHYYPYHLWDDRTKLLLPENAGQAKGLYAPELIHQKTLRWIEENRDRPFFCFVPMVMPHAELAAPPAYMERFRGKLPEGTPYVGTDDGPALRLGQYQSQKEPRVAFAAMVSMIDDQVGEIVAKLEALGLADRTLIIFSSDNGPHQEGGADPEFFDSNGPWRGFKRDLYEGGIHVPMIAYWPGKIAPGRRTDHISAFWDVLPTLTEIAGVSAPSGIDGLSFLPTLLGRDSGQAQHDYLYWEFHEGGGRMALRQGNWKLVKYNVLKQPDQPGELYDLATDPAEANNLAATHPEICQRLGQLMRTARTPSPDFNFESKAYDGGTKTK